MACPFTPSRAITRALRVAAFAGLAALLAACGGGSGSVGGGGGSTPPPVITNANPEGLYTGTLVNSVAGTTWPVFAIVLKDGTFAIFAKQSDFAPKVPVGIVLSGAKIAPLGGAFSTSYSAFTQPGLTFTNGASKVSGTLNGTIVPGVSITGAYVSPLDAGTFTVSAMTDYSRAASGATIAGTYRYSYFANNRLVDATTTIDANGTTTVSDTAMCQGPGSYAVPDATRNAYRVTNNATCPSASGNALSVGLEAFFPAGTGAAINGGTNFSTDTLIAVADNGTYGFMVIASK